RVVVGEGPRPLLDARTHSDGRVLFLAQATDGAGPGPWPVTVEVGGAKTSATLAAAGPDLTVTVGPAAGDPGQLDVVFLLDATGSMGDELGRLATNMASTAAKVSAAAGDGVRPRFGLTAFKDRGDDYVTRTFGLTADLGAFRTALAAVTAGGGGDTPESLAAGLHEAVTKQPWGGDDVAKVIVLVGDAAPPEYQDEPDYAADARDAAARGIRIHAIASSGLGDQGEYAFRQLAQLTAGRFVFLTYGADGGPGEITPHHVDKYAVKSLDELVATLLIEELQPGRQTQ
ncbi:MAG: vWA domain-containing protein, partial [Acidimicrobiales bacterium]